MCFSYLADFMSDSIHEVLVERAIGSRDDKIFEKLLAPQKQGRRAWPYPPIITCGQTALQTGKKEENIKIKLQH